MTRNSLNRSLLLALLIFMTMFIYSTAFALTIDSATLDGSATVTKDSGATISAKVDVTVVNPNGWGSTSWSIGLTDGTRTCVDHADHNADGSFSETFDISAPFDPNTYNVYVEAFGNNNCTGSSSGVYTMSNAVTITKAPTTTTFQLTPTTSYYGEELTISVTVTGGSTTPTGSVEFMYGGTDCTDATSLLTLPLDGSGQISATASPHIPPGHYTGTIRSCYGGDDTHETSSGTADDHTVVKADQTLLVDGPASVTYGSTDNITYSCPDLGCPGTGLVSYAATGASTGCTVDPTTGVITVTSASGTCSVYVTKAEDTNYNSATSPDFSVPLNKANQSPLTVTGPAIVTYGTPGQITTSGGSGTGTMSYSHGASAGCTVDPTTGVVTVTNADASGTCTVTATKASDDNYESATSLGANIQLNANQEKLIVTGPASVTYGTTGQITTSGGSGNGALSYAATGSSTGCTVDSNTGVITVTTASGTCTVTATKAADGNYLETTSEPATVILNKATPTASLSVTNSPVTFDGSGHAADVEITSSSVPGSLSNILTGGEATQNFIGTYAVTADFIPTDTENYAQINNVPAGDFVIIGPNHIVLPAATGNGNITLDANCSFTSWGVKTIYQVPGDPLRYDYPYGLVEFTLDCKDAVVVITYPGDISQLQYRKYGPTTPGDLDTAAWYDFKGKITASNQIALHFEDNKLGDDTGDDGIIVDQGGVSHPPITVPTMNEWGMIIFMAFAGLGAIYYLRRRSAKG